MKLVSIILALALVIPTASGQDADDEKLARAFEKALKKIERAVEASPPGADPKAMKKPTAALAELLEEHARAAHAIAARPRLEKLMVEIAVRTDPQRPNLSAIIGDGAVKKADPETGEIDISWTRDKARGLQATSDRKALTFPFHFRDEHVVEIEGKAYPDSGDVCFIATCLKAKQALVVGFGREADKDEALVTPGIIQQIDGRQGVLVRKERAVFKGGKRWKARVKVTRKSVTAYAGSKKLFAADRPEDWWGGAGFADRGDWTRVRIQGRSDLDAFPWKDLAEAAARHDAAVRKNFDPRPLLPEWLRTP